MLCGALRCFVVLCGASWGSRVLCGALRCFAGLRVLCGALRCRAPPLLLRVALGGAGVGRAGAPPLLLRVEGSVGEAQWRTILRCHLRRMDDFKIPLAQKTTLRYSLREIRDFKIPFAQNGPCVVKICYGMRFGGIR